MQSKCCFVVSQKCPVCMWEYRTANGQTGGQTGYASRRYIHKNNSQDVHNERDKVMTSTSDIDVICTSSFPVLIRYSKQLQKFGLFQ